ncbi:hypothetical protein ACG2LH_12590 [Zhouia sp. PK063]|uniref:hypothetical protein n=1 Tax=Zhouia sp. PK063 TaxID=3373602 RepID=UPI0037982751
MKYVVACICICVCCTKENNGFKAERSAYIFLGNVHKEEVFTLTYLKNKNKTVYTYVSKADTSKTITVTKPVKHKKLLWGADTFIKSNRAPFKCEKLANLPFDFYYLETTVTDGTGPLLFNVNYGLLAIHNNFGPNVIFLKYKNDTLAKQLQYKWNE